MSGAIALASSPTFLYATSNVSKNSSSSPIPLKKSLDFSFKSIKPKRVTPELLLGTTAL